MSPPPRSRAPGCRRSRSTSACAPIPRRARSEQAQQLYKDKQAAKAGAIFGRYHSLEAQVGSALAGWPDGTVERAPGARAPRTRVARSCALHLGLAFYWTRRRRRGADRLAGARGGSSPTRPTPCARTTCCTLSTRPACRASCPRSRRRLRSRCSRRRGSSPRSARAAAHGGAHAKILYGTALQQLGRPVSAEREFAAAARLAPNDPDARTAAAVGLFDKANPSRAFGRLGPLVRVFPHAQTVRFHLGVMLLWVGAGRGRPEAADARRGGGAGIAAGQASGARTWPRFAALGPADGKMSRSAYGVRPVAMRECRIRARRVRNVTKPREGAA